jgi:hypothetical protein
LVVEAAVPIVPKLLVQPADQVVVQAEMQQIVVEQEPQDKDLQVDQPQELVMHLLLVVAVLAVLVVMDHLRVPDQPMQLQEETEVQVPQVVYQVQQQLMLAAAEVLLIKHQQDPEDQVAVVPEEMKRQELRAQATRVVAEVVVEIIIFLVEDKQFILEVTEVQELQFFVT